MAFLKSCYHTGHLDWKYSTDQNKCETKWSYDQKMVDEARLFYLIYLKVWMILERLMMRVLKVWIVIDGVVLHFIIMVGIQDRLKAWITLSFIHLSIILSLYTRSAVCLGTTGSLMHNSKAEEMITL